MCSIFVPMRVITPRPAQTDWPRPPSCLTASQLRLPPDNARIAVAGLVILRQRPGTAKGVIFLTLEDETGTVNIIVWRKLYERYRRAVIAGRMLRVTGRLQSEGDVIHVIAEVIEDISPLLDQLLAPAPEDRPDHQPEALSPDGQTG
ncbi:OB-fold nucleic acid binding domain-containing protein [Marivita sp.]|uniref:OB-fold nucleic acid binding domain-containing protein n=1 Tax=Marivita sp. TaxID=2003365 RepID=UPI003F7123B5